MAQATKRKQPHKPRTLKHASFQSVGTRPMGRERYADGVEHEVTLTRVAPSTVSPVIARHIAGACNRYGADAHCHCAMGGRAKCAECAR